MDLSKIEIPLSNRFDALSGDGNKDAEKKTKSNKPSPIVITNHDTDISEVVSVLKEPFHLKIVSVGRKLFLNSAADKKAATSALSILQIPFYSHPDNDNKIFKVVLTGLPELPEKDILDHLINDMNLKPSKVSMFKTKSSNKLYLVHFNKSEITMSDLKKLNVVLHHIIKWVPFKPKNTGPVQCRSCCLYGHGITHCNRPSVCCICAANHVTTDCPDKDNDKFVFKCYFCASAETPHNHRADDISCPFREKYIQARHNSRNTNKNQKTNPPTNTTNVQRSERVVAAPPPPLLSMSYAAATSSNGASHFAFNQQQQKQQQHQYQPTNAQPLWSMQEITKILFNSINELKQCSSKLDQLKVIANLLTNACE